MGAVQGSVPLPHFLTRKPSGTLSGGSESRPHRGCQSLPGFPRKLCSGRLTHTERAMGNSPRKAQKRKAVFKGAEQWAEAAWPATTPGRCHALDLRRLCHFPLSTGHSGGDTKYQKKDQVCQKSIQKFEGMTGVGIKARHQHQATARSCISRDGLKTTFPDLYLYGENGLFLRLVF